MNTPTVDLGSALSLSTRNRTPPAAAGVPAAAALKVAVAATSSQPAGQARPSGQAQASSPVQASAQAEAATQAQASGLALASNKSGATDKSEESSQTQRDQLNDVLDRISRLDHRLSFTVDEDSGKSVVVVRDARTSEVLKQFPSEEMLNVARRLEEHLKLAGDVAGVLHAGEA